MAIYTTIHYHERQPKNQNVQFIKQKSFSFRKYIDFHPTQQLSL